MLAGKQSSGIEGYLASLPIPTATLQHSGLQLQVSFLFSNFFRICPQPPNPYLCTSRNPTLI
jgi:hypothetical protein